MSGSLPVQYSKIQIRRGPAAELPGVPPSMGAPPSPGLDIGEFGYTSDTGRLFIGIDPTTGLPQLVRTTFPYDNVEVLTENSTDALLANFDQNLQDVQTAFIISDPLAYATTAAPVTVTTPSESTVTFKISLPVGNPGQAQIFYHLFDPNSTPANNPVKTGILKVMYGNGSLPPSMTDCGTAFNNPSYGGVDPNVAYGGVQFIATYDSGSSSVILQYINVTSTVPVMCFRIERAVYPPVS
jgi:hypothetical protein